MDSRVVFDQELNERRKQRFASLSGVVNTLEEVHVGFRGRIHPGKDCSTCYATSFSTDAASAMALGESLAKHSVTPTVPQDAPRVPYALLLMARNACTRFIRAPTQEERLKALAHACV